MGSDIKLLPCPFCGGEARLINGIPKINYIKCKRCQTMTSNSEVIERVIELWNTRKPIDMIVEQLEEDRTCRCRLEGYIPKWKAIELVKAGGKV